MSSMIRPNDVGRALATCIQNNIEEAYATLTENLDPVVKCACSAIKHLDIETARYYLGLGRGIAEFVSEYSYSETNLKGVSFNIGDAPLLTAVDDLTIVGSVDGISVTGFEPLVLMMYEAVGLTRLTADTTRHYYMKRFLTTIRNWINVPMIRVRTSYANKSSDGVFRMVAGKGFCICTATDDDIDKLATSILALTVRLHEGTADNYWAVVGTAIVDMLSINKVNSVETGIALAPCKQSMSTNFVGMSSGKLIFDSAPVGKMSIHLFNLPLLSEILIERIITRLPQIHFPDFEFVDMYGITRKIRLRLNKLNIKLQSFADIALLPLKIKEAILAMFNDILEKIKKVMLKGWGIDLSKFSNIDQIKDPKILAKLKEILDAMTSVLQRFNEVVQSTLENALDSLKELIKNITANMLSSLSTSMAYNALDKITVPPINIIVKIKTLLFSVQGIAKATSTISKIQEHINELKEMIASATATSQEIKDIMDGIEADCSEVQGVVNVVRAFEQALNTLESVTISPIEASITVIDGIFTVLGTAGTVIQGLMQMPGVNDALNGFDGLLSSTTTPIAEQLASVIVNPVDLIPPLPDIGPNLLQVDASQLFKPVNIQI